ncbi:hypothetical protein ANO11243_080130 [Dothideomycetidae sp. 11243]|nr:hypothetical protein ANO11243_080130 [fungal sp. No.11243]
MAIAAKDMKDEETAKTCMRAELADWRNVASRSVRQTCLGSETGSGLHAARPSAENVAFLPADLSPSDKTPVPMNLWWESFLAVKFEQGRSARGQ